MNESLVSAGEAARRLGVSPATVQRWVDNGILHAERTPGGHRRIYVTELRRLIAANRPVLLSAPLANWLDVLLRSDSGEVKSALIAARRAARNWAEVAEEIASAIAELGRRWEIDDCRVFEEHAATESLRRAAATVANEIHRAKDAPRAVLFTVQGERHTLGLSLAELVLGEAGWRSSWIGEGPPLQELQELVIGLKPDLFVVSASTTSPTAAISEYQAELVRVAKSANARLVLGGSAPWSVNRKHRAKILRSFTELHRFLEGI
jgi:excisionase family DNA binding protein